MAERVSGLGIICIVFISLGRSCSCIDDCSALPVFKVKEKAVFFLL